jgi:methyltransferase
MFAFALLALAFLPMILEARYSASNARALLAAGASEPQDDVYRAMQIVYPTCFVAMVAEAWLRERGLGGVAWLGAAVFAAAKAIKYWAIATLGSRWSFRVLVPPGGRLIAHGPYRFLRHPNYVGVAGELIGFALLAQTPVSGVASVLLFAIILRARIRVEERALGLEPRKNPGSWKTG